MGDTIYTEENIQKLAPKPNAFIAGKKLANSAKWELFAKSERSIWGNVKGSGKKPYKVQIDLQELAYKCSCPSRQFPCKHSLALLLLHAKENDKFKQKEEPDYVSEWLDKRKSRAEKIDQEEKELTANDKKKRASAKAKRDGERAEFVASGVKELNLWLKDLIRLGLLTLPTKDSAYFENMAKKMVDAKAPGLAAWVRAFNNLNYKDKSAWQEDAISIISKLHLLLQSFHHMDPENKVMANTIKSHLGYTFKTKELTSNPTTKIQKDHWLVLGSTAEVGDDLTINRTWLHGLESDQSAIIIVFESRFSNIAAVPLMDGSVIEAALAFYPDSAPHRAIIQKQNGVSNTYSIPPKFNKDWIMQHTQKVGFIKANPWTSNRSYIIENVQLINDGKYWLLVDEDKNYKIIEHTYDEEKLMSLLLMSNNAPFNVAFLERTTGIYPLGVFEANKYICL